MPVLMNSISGHQQRMPGPLPGAIPIPPALLVVADFTENVMFQSDIIKFLAFQDYK
jgi:hypothetical protein